jgi:hypothetical protein
MSTLKPREAERLKSVEDKVQRRIHTTLSAEVVSYDSTEKKATVRILPYVDEPVADLQDVPVVWSSTNRFSSEGGLQAGDQGLLHCHELDPSEVYRLGAQTAIKNWRRHGYYGEFSPRIVGDGIAKGPALGPTEWAISAIDGSVQIKLSTDGTVTIKAETIKLSSDAPGDFMALASKVEENLNNLKTAFDSHTHMHAPGPSAPVPTAPPAAPAPTISSTASAHVESD